MTIGTPPSPKHVQVREALRAQARNMHPGDPVESERELMQRFDVSRTTVRAAIQALVDDGLLVKEPARGTFVAPRRVESRMHLASFTTDMLRRGHVPTTQVLSFTSVPATAAGEHFFTAGRAWRIERCRLADGEPIAYEITYVACSCAPILDMHDLGASLYDALRTRYGVAPDSAAQSVTAVAASDAVAGHLNCQPGAPLLLFDRRSRAAGQPVERTLSWYLGERYTLHVDLDAQMRSD